LVLALVLALIYVIRIMLLTLLAAAAPLALACHALPHTEGLARLWWRAFAGVLAIQVAQALVMITTLRVFFSDDRSVLFGANPIQAFRDLLLLVCLLYILIRIPSWISQMVFRGGMRRSPIARIVRYAVAAAIFGRAVPALAGRFRGGAATGGPWNPPAKPTRAPSIPPTQPVPPATPQPQRWVQPELPLGSPSPRGTQLELPINPSSKPGGQRWIQPQLPLRGTTPSRPRWEQTRLPIRIRAEQQQLPLTIPPQHVQSQLPVAFPQRGSPEAGSSPRRGQQAAAMRHTAELQARAHQRQLDQTAGSQRETARSRWWRWGGVSPPNTPGGNPR
jgi:hypothetical protein